MSTDSFGLNELAAQATWLRRLAAILADEDAADDIVQETVLAAWQHPPDTRGPIRPWLRRVLTNASRMRRRSERQRHQRQHAWADASATAVPTPEELVQRHETLRQLAAAVSGLPEPYRSTVLLHFSEQRSTSEIARQLGVPAGTVRWRLSEAVARLRAALDSAHGGDRRRWALAFAALTPAPTKGTATAGLIPAASLVLAAMTVLAVLANRDDTAEPRAKARAKAGAMISAAPPASPPANSPRAAASTMSRPFLSVSRPAIINDPNSAGYDPMTLTPFAEPKQIFEAEPRVCAWAAAMEVRLERNILAELGARVPDATVEAVVCRHSTCSLVLTVPPDDGRRRHGAAMIALQRPPIAPLVAFPAADAKQPSRLEVYLLFSPAERETKAYDRWYTTTRTEFVKGLSGKDNPPANRPANPPAAVTAQDPSARERACRHESVAPLTAPVMVPDAPSPLEELSMRRDPGANAVENAFKDLVARKVRLCHGQRTGGAAADYSRLRVRGWGEAVPQTLTVSNVHLEVTEGAPLDRRFADCLGGELAGTIVLRPDRWPFVTVSDWLEAGVRLNARAASP